MSDEPLLEPTVMRCPMCEEYDVTACELRRILNPAVSEAMMQLVDRAQRRGEDTVSVTDLERIIVGIANEEQQT